MTRVMDERIIRVMGDELWGKKTLPVPGKTNAGRGGVGRGKGGKRG